MSSWTLWLTKYIQPRQDTRKLFCLV